MAPQAKELLSPFDQQEGPNGNLPCKTTFVDRSGFIYNLIMQGNYLAPSTPIIVWGERGVGKTTTLKYTTSLPGIHNLMYFDVMNYYGSEQIQAGLLKSVSQRRPMSFSEHGFIIR